MVATQPNVELEASKFLHKLVQQTKDEPTELATKLYLISQHMRSTGKENTIHYQVILRAMETVINQHGLNFEALMSSYPPLASGTHIVDSSASQVAGSSPRAAAEKDSKDSFAADGSAKIGTCSSGLLIGRSSSGHDTYQESVSHLNGTYYNIHGRNLGALGSYALNKQGIQVHGVGPKMVNGGRVEAFTTRTERSSCKGKAVVQEGGYFNSMSVANKTIQGGMSNNVLEITMLGNDCSRDSWKLPVQASTTTSTPFKEHQLKQLRAQCLVFWAFKNKLKPKKLPLDIALGNFIPKEELSACRRPGQILYR